MPTRPYEFASETDLRWRGYYAAIESEGLPYGSKVDDRGQILIDAHIELHKAGRFDEADEMIRELQARGARLRAARDRATLAELKQRMLAGLAALDRASRRWAQEKMDLIAVQIHGVAGAAKLKAEAAVFRLAAQVYGADWVAAREPWLRLYPDRRYPPPPAGVVGGSAAATAGQFR